MDRENMIDLIKAIEDFDKLDAQIAAMTNNAGLSDSDYRGLTNMLSVLARNSRYANMNIEEEKIFLTIVYSNYLSSEEKCNLLQVKQ